MKTASVVVLPYDAAWKTAFAAIKSELEKALGDLAIAIEHVGSTSVEGLSAKPCIDVDVVIRAYAVLTRWWRALRQSAMCTRGTSALQSEKPLPTRTSRIS